MPAENTSSGSCDAGSRPSEHASPLEKALRRIRRTCEFPAISKYVIEINQKLHDTSVHASASELANVILKDFALTNKLLKLVNSAFYGFVAGKVTTVTRAVVLLGHDHVRMAAISLALFDHFKRRSTARDLKEELIRSFWCGLLAREITRTRSGVDPEEAFICGLLHRLGRLLVIYHLDHDFRKIQYHVSQLGEKEDQAVNRILGLSYRSLGKAVAKQWNFPETICRSMEAVGSDDLKDPRRRVDPLLAMTAFSHGIARIISDLEPDRQKTAIEKMLQRYERYISLSFRQVRTMIGESLDKLRSHADALQLDVTASDFLSRLCGAAERKAIGKIDGSSACPETEASTAYQLMGDEAFGDLAQAYQAGNAVEILMEGIQELSSSMVGSFDLNDIALMSLEVLYRALDCNRAILFIHEHQHRTMQARFGYGENIQEIVGKIEFEMGSFEDLFNQAIAAGKDLVVEDARASELYPLIPEWYRKGIDAQSFIFLPVIYRGICVGALYADMESAGSFINPIEHRYVTMLRNQIVLAIKMGR